MADNEMYIGMSASGFFVAKADRQKTTPLLPFCIVTMNGRVGHASGSAAFRTAKHTNCLSVMGRKKEVKTVSEPLDIEMEKPSAQQNECRSRNSLNH
jgi:hypothetical protein